jgi:hypothetical protein
MAAVKIPKSQRMPRLTTTNAIAIMPYSEGEINLAKYIILTN